MKNIAPKKTLGQNFLKSKEAIEKIVNASLITPGDIVVEVGPGEGVLTNELLLAGAHVIAIEKDQRCIPLLSERFSDALADGHLQLIDGDILDPNNTHVLFNEMLRDVPTYKVVANIPYYITGLLFRFFLEEHRQPTLLTFLVQKEVADNIIARDKKESILSLSIKVFGEPHYGGKVSKEHFTPPPKVDSAIITITDIGHERLGGVSEKKFFSILKAGFRARRKKLINNLSDGLDYDKKDLLGVFQKLHINEKVRGEDLPITTWVALAQVL
jgi:16S rRNA (adenine1518-N6/adenine1519-N6)-dimethyltransferase